MTDLKDRKIIIVGVDKITGIVGDTPHFEVRVAGKAQKLPFLDMAEGRAFRGYAHRSDIPRGPRLWSVRVSTEAASPECVESVTCDFHDRSPRVHGLVCLPPCIIAVSADYLLEFINHCDRSGADRFWKRAHCEVVISPPQSIAA